MTKTMNFKITDLSTSYNLSTNISSMIFVSKVCIKYFFIGTAIFCAAIHLFADLVFAHGILKIQKNSILNQSCGNWWLKINAK